MNRILFVLVVLFFTRITYSQAQKFNPPFFVFEDGLWNAQSDSPKYWAKLTKEIGFDGVELIGLDKVESMLPELEKHDLELFTLYIQIDIDKEQAYDPRLKEYIKKLKNTGLHLWVHVHSNNYPCSDSSGDEACVKIVTELADYCAGYGVKIAFYPHVNFWLEKVNDGLRLVEKIDKSNVGVVFNLCHFLKKDKPHKIKRTLEEAMPHLFLVSINGADKEESYKLGWDRLIQPLGQGTYNVYTFLEMLKELGYKNPIGLQCYNIKGESEYFLKESMITWNKYIKKLNE